MMLSSSSSKSFSTSFHPQKGGFSWRFALILIGILFLTAQLLVLVVWLWPYSFFFPEFATEIPRHLGRHFNENAGMRTYEPYISIDPRKQPTSVERMVDNPLVERVQEIACNKRTNRCFYVVDGQAHWSSGFARSLMVVPLKEMVIAEVGFDAKSECDPLASDDPTECLLRNDQLVMDHLKVMAAQPFVTGTLPTYTNVSQSAVDSRGNELFATGPKWRLLFFGAGGSLPLSSFFFRLLADTNSKRAHLTTVEADPTLAYLVGKWWGAGELQSHTVQQEVVVEEATNWLAARRPAEEPPFDIVFVNDCYYTRKKHAACPTRTFARPITAARLREAISDGGTLVINVFSLPATTEEVEEEAGDDEIRRADRQKLAISEHRLLALYNRYFGNSCYYVEIAQNMILTCKKVKVEESNEDKNSEDAQTTKAVDDNDATASDNDVWAMELPKMTQKRYREAFARAELPDEWARFVTDTKSRGARVVQEIGVVP